MKTFVLNVRTNELRRTHIISMLEKHACCSGYSFMHNGDLEDINDEIFKKYFGGELNTKRPIVSCNYKHYLIYCELQKDTKNKIFLVLEDDIYLSKNFCSQLNIIKKEIEERQLNNFIISLEESSLKYVKNSVRKKNIHLYKQEYGRMTGAYLVDKTAAINMIKEIEAHKFNLPIDWFHNYCSDNGIINIFWAQPAIAIQGSLNGKIKSMLDNKKFGLLRQVLFNFNRLYKKLLYKLR